MEHVLRFLLPQVVDQQNGEAQPIRQPLQHGQIPVVVGVGSVVDRPNHLQRVDDDQHRAGMLYREGFDLFLQPLADGKALRTEVDALWRVLRDFEQPVLDA